MRKITAGCLIVICIVSCACSRQPDNSPISSENTTHYIPVVTAGDFAPGQLEAHYLKHRYQFGDIAQAQYLKNAQDLLNAPPDKDVLQKMRTDGEYCTL